jgi:hypothetical protein
LRILSATVEVFSMQLIKNVAIKIN